MVFRKCKIPGSSMTRFALALVSTSLSRAQAPMLRQTSGSGKLRPPSDPDGLKLRCLAGSQECQEDHCCEARKYPCADTNGQVRRWRQEGLIDESCSSPPLQRRGRAP